jgi:DNA-directed RNA polymerase specialized sigma24 family protein
MTRPYNERRNQKVIRLVERLGLPHKDVARRLRITATNVRQILFRYRHSVTQSNVQPLKA